MVPSHDSKFSVHQHSFNVIELHREGICPFFSFPPPFLTFTISRLLNLVLQQRPADNDRYVKNCRNGRSPKETRWWFHDDKV